MTKLTSFFALFFTFTLSAQAIGIPFSFTDIPPDHQYFTATKNLRSQGILKGFADGTYHPDQAVTRAEFTALIIKAIFPKIEIDRCTPNRSFHDAISSDWFYPYLCMGITKNIIQGFADGTFKPHQKISYAESLKIALEAVKAPLGVSPPRIWYQKYTDFAKSKNLSLADWAWPDHFINRGEMAAIVYWLQQISLLGPICKYDADCQNGFTCTNQHCIPSKQCSINAECPTGYDCLKNICAISTHCYANSDCPTGFQCFDSTCKTAIIGNECIVDAQCPKTQYCLNYKCEEAGSSCYSSGDCPPHYKCIYMTCTQNTSCFSASDCPSGYSCGTYSHRCEVLPDCTENKDCPIGFQCQLQKCQILPN